MTDGLKNGAFQRWRDASRILLACTRLTNLGVSTAVIMAVTIPWLRWRKLERRRRRISLLEAHCYRLRRRRELQHWYGQYSHLALLARRAQLLTLAACRKLVSSCAARGLL